ncbi:Multiple epidermal growth factor-like domains protein 8 [Phlyctochytrium planicorne]|nr:Multiple epidermal growth factor-like domains protein 8 [Phlyctochytrium planicorne]
MVSGVEGSNGTRTGDRLYIFGGGFEGEQPVDDAAVYCLDVDAMLWIQLTPSTIPKNVANPTPRFGHTLSMIGTCLFSFGGFSMPDRTITNELWVFDTVRRAWKQLEYQSEYTPKPRYGHSSCIVNDQRLLIYAGMSKNEGKPFVLDDLAELDLGDWVLCPGSEN